MLTTPSEKLLAELLHRTAELEKRVERSRQVLCKEPEFDPYAAFTLIDRLAIRGLSLTDLKEFLTHAGVYSPTELIDLVVKQYDSDGDARLSLPDFFNLALPAENMSLRDATENRRLGPSVSFNAQLLLAKHIQFEAEQQSQISELKRKFLQMPDFNNHDAFRTVDRQGLNHIDRPQLRKFLKKYRFAGLDSDLDAIIRRVDTDGDGKIAYVEFLEYLNLVGVPSQLSKSRETSPARSAHYSPSKCSSPLRNTRAFDETSFGIHSPGRQASPLKTTCAVGGQAYRHKSIDFSSIRTTLFGSSQELDEVVGLFKTQVSLAKDFERLKESLALQSDFTLTDFFRLLDLDDKGYILPTDLEDFYSDIGILSHPNDIYLLLKHYNTQQNSRLSLTEFEVMWMPKESYYADMLHFRHPLIYPPQNRTTMFSHTTHDKILAAFKVVVEFERVSEEIHKQLTKKSWIRIKELFDGLDRFKDGSVSTEEFEAVLKAYSEDEDTSGLATHFTKEKGRVSYTAFLNEL